MGYFIPHDKLANLAKYKYQSEDRSIITKYVLKPFWNKFVLIFPLWMAPNVVTLLGFVFILINLITVFYFDPFLEGAAPKWVYFTYALGLFMYQTFDACDGTHARRTGQSGPLGELFDHCVDALNTTLSVIISASVFGFGYSWLLVVAQFSTLTNFYLSTWEEYHTHKLFLSEFSGPVEGILGVVGLFTITGFYGSQIWKEPLFQIDLSSIKLSSEYQITPIDIFVVLSGLGLYFNIESARRNVANYYKDSKKEIQAYKGLLPFFYYYLTVVFWLWYNPLIVQEFLLPIILTIGLTIAFNVGRIIVGHLTLQEFPYLTPSYIIPTLEFLIYSLLIQLGYDPKIATGALVWTGLGLSLGLYSMFIVEIIYEITTYLDIYALSIKHPKKLE